MGEACHIVSTFGKIIYCGYTISFVGVEFATVYHNFLSLGIIAVLINYMHIGTYAVSTATSHDIEYIFEVRTFDIEHSYIVAEWKHVDYMAFRELALGQTVAQSAFVCNSKIYAVHKFTTTHQNVIGKEIEQFGTAIVELSLGSTNPLLHKRIDTGRVFADCSSKLFVGIAVVTAIDIDKFIVGI